jgi:hypothetical protein
VFLALAGSAIAEIIPGKGGHSIEAVTFAKTRCDIADAS